MEPVNKEVLSLIGDQITLSGQELVWNDWKILKVNSRDLNAITMSRKLTEQLVAFEEGMTTCGRMNKIR
jgi:hypothetical protein